MTFTPALVIFLLATLLTASACLGLIWVGEKVGARAKKAHRMYRFGRKHGQPRSRSVAIAWHAFWR